MAPSVKILQPGYIFFHENDKSREMFIIQRGRVRVYRNEKGQKVDICELSKGAIVGEMSLLDGRSRSATVEALEETEVSVVTLEEFERRSHTIPEWFLGIIRIMCARLRDIDRKLKTSLEEEVPANVASLISMMMNKKNKTGERTLEENELDLKTSKNEMMEILCLPHNRVTAALQELASYNLVTVGNNTLKVNDKQALVLFSKFKRGIELDQGVDIGHPLADNAMTALKLLYEATKNSKADKNGECELAVSALGADAGKLFEGDLLKELTFLNAIAYDEKKLADAKAREAAKITVNRKKIGSILAVAMFGPPGGKA